jgi:hypothetical protein
MDTDNAPLGSPVSLAGLKALGAFVGWQDLENEAYTRRT